MTATNNPWREVVAEWQGDTAFIARNASGGSVQIGTVEGRPSLSAMEMLLAGMAGCSGADVASILEKMRQPLAKLQVKARGKRAESHPRVYTEIEISYIFEGEGLDLKSVEQAIQLSLEKYCAASATLGAHAKIHATYQVSIPGGPAGEVTAIQGVSPEGFRK